MNTAERIQVIEDRVDRFDHRFSDMETSMKDVADAVNGLRSDVQDLKLAKEQGEIEAAVKVKSKAEADRRVQEALSRYGIEEHPSGLHMQPMKPMPSNSRGTETQTQVHADQSGVDVTIKQQSAASIFVKYIVDTPRHWLGAFLLLMAALLAGGPSVADRILDYVIGPEEESRSLELSVPHREQPYEPAPVAPSSPSLQP